MQPEGTTGNRAGSSTVARGVVPAAGAEGAEERRRKERHLVTIEQAVEEAIRGRDFAACCN
jgi:hypothetical protein